MFCHANYLCIALLLTNIDFVSQTIVETDTSKPQLSSKKEKVVNSNPFFHEETEDIETHQNGFHSNPFAGYENSRSAITAASEVSSRLFSCRLFCSYIAEGYDMYKCIFCVDLLSN